LGATPDCQLPSLADCPGVAVDEHEARSIRRCLVDALEAATPDGDGGGGGGVDFNELIDESVFIHKTLRLLGSRKATKGVDKGRVYELVAVYDGRCDDGVRDIEAEEAYRRSALDAVRLLADVSIRVDTPKN